MARVKTTKTHSGFYKNTLWFHLIYHFKQIYYVLALLLYYSSRCSVFQYIIMKIGHLPTHISMTQVAGTKAISIFNCNRN